MSEDENAEVEKLERLAEAAYEARYGARRHNVKDCFEDSVGYFAQAIDAARRARQPTNVVQINLRHINLTYPLLGSGGRKGG